MSKEFGNNLTKYFAHDRRAILHIDDLHRPKSIVSKESGSLLVTALYRYTPSLNGGRDNVVGTGWTVRGSNSSGGEIFRTSPDRPLGPPSLLYNGYRVIPGGKAARAWRSPPIPIFSAEVLNWVELYLYPS